MVGEVKKGEGEGKGATLPHPPPRSFIRRIVADSKRLRVPPICNIHLGVLVW